ncbi:sulfotransferase [Microtetraspora sp. AC03309]|uniref:sulfotransferase family protein n=1 Tax=Microtetraspora sp. AC03309 TaxID=2779376 RepID=UPI001E2EC4E7|nr:sulfotransferase [Microtetraspora sp. AC03309]MCC5579369.1 sulfotransferase [Microtetraspora sp. AC03309]
MSWKRKVNAAVAGITGYHLTPVGKSSDPSKERSEGKGTAAKGQGAAAAPYHPAGEDDRLVRAPVFVISPVRAGSTLLRSMLNSHSMIHAPHELHVRRLTVGYGNSLVGMAMEALGHSRGDLEHLLWDRVLHRELVRSGKRIIVEKTPANAFAAERIAACWPDVRFVFLLRHPLSIARSWHEAGGGKRDMDEAARDALRYMKAVQRARRAFPGLTVRYEDLTAEPVATTRLICDFLEIPWEEGMLTWRGEAAYQKGLGDWKDKIKSGAVQSGRPLPAADEVPAVLQEQCRTWGYLT